MPLLKLTDRDGDVWYQSRDRADSYTTEPDVSEAFADGQRMLRLARDYGPLTVEIHEPKPANVTITLPMDVAENLLNLLRQRHGYEKIYNDLFDQGVRGTAPTFASKASL